MCERRDDPSLDSLTKQPQLAVSAGIHADERGNTTDDSSHVPRTKLIPCAVPTAVPQMDFTASGGEQEGQPEEKPEEERARKTHRVSTLAEGSFPVESESFPRCAAVAATILSCNEERVEVKAGGQSKATGGAVFNKLAVPDFDKPIIKSTMTAKAASEKAPSYSHDFVAPKSLAHESFTGEACDTAKIAHGEKKDGKHKEYFGRVGGHVSADEQAECNKLETVSICSGATQSDLHHSRHTTNPPMKATIQDAASVGKATTETEMFTSSSPSEPSSQGQEMTPAEPTADLSRAVIQGTARDEHRAVSVAVGDDIALVNGLDAAPHSDQKASQSPAVPHTILLEDSTLATACDGAKMAGEGRPRPSPVQEDIDKVDTAADVRSMPLEKSSIHSQTPFGNAAPSVHGNEPDIMTNIPPLATSPTQVESRCTTTNGSLWNWLHSEREACNSFSPMAEADLKSGCYPRPATNPRESGWKGIPKEMFDDGCHGVTEGVSVFTGSSTPHEVLQGKGCHSESLKVLRRQGAIKVKCNDVWNKSHECSALLDLRWLHPGDTKLKSLRGHFSFLQQTLPRGSKPYVEMVEESRNKMGKTSFGEMLDEVDKTFKALCSPYRGLGPKEREALFLKMLRARVGTRFPYLTSVALDALNGNMGRGSERSRPPSGPHPWEPNSVADGEESILRRMLDTCEQRCTPKELLDQFTSIDTKQSRKRKQPVEGNLNESSLNDDRNADVATDGEEVKEGAAGPTAPGSSGEGNNRIALWGAGIISPWLYFMSMGSVFCCHIEDYAFGSANVILSPPGSHAWVVWYSVPRQDIGNLHEYLRGLLGQDYTLDCLEQRKLWLDPASVAAWRGPKGENIDVYRHLQGPSEYIATDYGSVHWGVNLGVGWKAAVNFAYPGWREAAEGVHQMYKKLESATGQKRNYRCVPDFDSENWRNDQEYIVSPNELKKG